MNATPPPPSRHWSCARDADDIAWLVIDRAEAVSNSLSAAVMTELDGQLRALAASPPRGVKESATLG